MKEIEIIAFGIVQGVFFRATVKEIAEDFNLSGYAKNLRDGSVEIVAQGPKPDLEEFLEIIKKSPGKSKVETCQSNLRDPKTKFSNFKIL